MVSAKNLLQQTPKQNREKRGICEEKKTQIKQKKNKQNKTKRDNNSGILLTVTQSFSGVPAGSRDHPSFMICSRARSLCTFTALVEIRCCGPSSCVTEREREGERRGERERARGTGENKESGFSEAVANMLRVAGSWLSHRLTGTANSMRNRRGREKKKECVNHNQK